MNSKVAFALPRRTILQHPHSLSTPHRRPALPARQATPRPTTPPSLSEPAILPTPRQLSTPGDSSHHLADPPPPSLPEPTAHLNGSKPTVNLDLAASMPGSARACTVSTKTRTAFSWAWGRTVGQVPAATASASDNWVRMSSAMVSPSGAAAIWTMPGMRMLALAPLWVGLGWSGGIR